MVCGSNASTASVWNRARRTRREYHVEDNDPLSAFAELRHTQTLSRDEWQIRVETQLRMSSTNDAFVLQGSLRAFDGAERSVSSRLGSLYSSRFLMISGINDEVILAARLLLATLFLIFGWRKLRDFSGTISQMVELGVPVPVLAAAVALLMELPVSFAVAIGAFTRPSAFLMFFYTLGTALIGHRYWTKTGADYVDSHGQLLQKSQHYGRLLAVVHYRCGKIFDRCLVQYRRAIICGLGASDVSFFANAKIIVRHRPPPSSHRRARHSRPSTPPGRRA